MSRSIAIMLALFLLTGCREREPEEAAEAFVATLEDYRQGPLSQKLERAWKLLDPATQAPILARAHAATAALGVEIAPWTLLRYDGLVRGDRVTRVEGVAIGDDRARVAVHFAWGVPKSAGGPAEAPEPHELSLVKTGDGWKVTLPVGTGVDARAPEATRPVRPPRVHPGGAGDGGAVPDAPAPVVAPTADAEGPP